MATLFGDYPDNMYLTNQVISWSVRPEKEVTFTANDLIINWQKVWKTIRYPFDMDDKEFTFGLKINTVYSSYTPRKYTLELTLKDNNYLDSITAVTVYINRQQPGYTFALLMDDKKTDADLTSSMEIYSKVTENNFKEVVVVFSYQRRNYTQNLQKNMKSILDSALHKDFKIKVGDATFAVHKAIIAAESKVLRSLLEADMVEKKNNQVELHGHSPDAVEAALEYIYTKKCNIVLDPVEIFKVAHFLQLADLQEQCKYHMMHESITAEVLPGILRLTALYNKSGLELLRAKAILFMKENTTALSEDKSVVNSLCECLEEDTVIIIMKIAAKYEGYEMAEKVIMYLKEQPKDILSKAEFTKDLKVDADFMLKMLKKSIDVMKLR